MDDTIIQTLKERFEALPKTIQEMIMSTNYEETLLKIGQNNKLNVAQLAVLEKETTMVMMGLTDPEDFEGDLTRELGVSRELGVVIVAEINEEIFKNIRSLLRLMSTGEDVPPKVEKSEVTEKKDEDVLKSAGIEIVNNQIDNKTPIENKEVEKTKQTMPSIIAQKLGGAFKNPTTETEHTDSVAPANSGNQQTVVKNIIPKIDPYREMPE